MDGKKINKVLTNLNIKRDSIFTSMSSKDKDSAMRLVKIIEEMHLNHWCMYYENGMDRNISGDRYDGFISANTLESLLKREFPCDSFFMKRVDRDEFDKNDMGMYQSADFGPHYMIKAKIENAPTLGDFMDILDSLPAKIGMHPITRPCVLKDNINNPTYLSGIAVIAESHIAMHYNMQSKEVLMDIFSCKTVDEDKYLEVMSKMFDEYKDVLILRGRKNEQRKDSQLNKHENHKHWQDVIV